MIALLEIPFYDVHVHILYYFACEHVYSEFIIRSLDRNEQTFFKLLISFPEKREFVCAWIHYWNTSIVKQFTVTENQYSCFLFLCGKSFVELREKTIIILAKEFCQFFFNKVDDFPVLCFTFQNFYINIVEFRPCSIVGNILAELFWCVAERKFVENICPVSIVTDVEFSA